MTLLQAGLAFWGAVVALAWMWALHRRHHDELPRGLSVNEAADYYREKEAA